MKTNAVEQIENAARLVDTTNKIYADKIHSVFVDLISTDERCRKDGDGLLYPLDKEKLCLYEEGTDYDGYEEEIPDLIGLYYDCDSGLLQLHTGFGEYNLTDLDEHSLVELAEFIQNRKKD